MYAATGNVSRRVMVNLSFNWSFIYLFSLTLLRLLNVGHTLYFASLIAQRVRPKCHLMILR